MNEGLKYLAIQAEKHQIKFKQTSKIVLIPMFAFLDELIGSMKKYTSTTHGATSWGQFIVATSNDRQFSNIYASWLSLNLSSLQCKLMSTLLPCRQKSKINIFLKLRKLVLKLKPESNKNLDIIQLQHEDVIGILHSAFLIHQTKKRIAQGVKQLFISYKMQQAKICSCVFIEYVLSMHEQIIARENNQATVSHQNQQYGVIPHSILGYSSIISQNSGNNLGVRQSQTNKTNNNKNSSNTSQYVSNFQSIIHDQNGLYRKMKSSQVSLQGYKVIDHKFHDSFNYSPQNRSKSNNMSYQHNSKRQVENSYESDKNRKNEFDNYRRQRQSNFSGFNLHKIQQIPNQQQKLNSKNKRRNEDTPPIKYEDFDDINHIKQEQLCAQNVNNSQIKMTASPQKYMINFRGIQDPQNYQQTNKKRKGIQVRTLQVETPNNNRSPLTYSKNNTGNSPSYSDRYKSSGISYQLTSNIQQSKYKQASNIKNIHSSVVKRLQIPNQQPSALDYKRSSPQNLSARKNDNLIKIEEDNRNSENQQQHTNKQISGGYEMWKKLNQRNKLFIQKMLKADLQRKKQQYYDKQNVSHEYRLNYQSANVIHDSVVRNSRDRGWPLNYNCN